MHLKHAGHTASLGAAAIVVAIAAGACGESNDAARACLPGDVQHCACDDPSRDGFRQCDPDAGSGWSACDCSGRDPWLPEASIAEAGADASDAGGALPFMSPCNQATDVCAGAGATCFPFNTKGPHCTHPCSSASDCPPPSGGCGNQGMCKPP